MRLGTHRIGPNRPSRGSCRITQRILDGRSLFLQSHVQVLTRLAGIYKRIPDYVRAGCPSRLTPRAPCFQVMARSQTLPTRTHERAQGRLLHWRALWRVVSDGDALSRFSRARACSCLSAHRHIQMGRTSAIRELISHLYCECYSVYAHFHASTPIGFNCLYWARCLAGTCGVLPFRAAAGYRRGGAHTAIPSCRNKYRDDRRSERASHTSGNL